MSCFDGWSLTDTVGGSVPEPPELLSAVGGLAAVHLHEVVGRPKRVSGAGLLRPCESSGSPEAFVTVVGRS